MYFLKSGTHLIAESTEERWINCVAHGHNILTLTEFEPSNLYPEIDILSTIPICYIQYAIWLVFSYQ